MKLGFTQAKLIQFFKALEFEEYLEVVSKEHETQHSEQLQKQKVKVQPTTISFYSPQHPHTFWAVIIWLSSNLQLQSQKKRKLKLSAEEEEQMQKEQELLFSKAAARAATTD